VECVIGLGPNLFYNSPMEACLLITKTNKESHKKGKVLFINAVNEVRQDKNMGFLEEHHIAKIFNAYKDFSEQEDFAVLVSVDDILAKKGNMAINLYIRPNALNLADSITFDVAYKRWIDSSNILQSSMDTLFTTLSES
jgi:type I restriction enzyme M protein